jgi:uracil-DNA glycosylase family 4
LDDVLALLRLQVEWGADEAIDANPIDRLRPIEVKPTTVVRAIAAVDAPLKATPNEQAMALLEQAVTLEQLHAVIAGFEGCALRDTASNTVFAEGDPTSTTLIIGEPPGREDDRSGHPFAGPEGALLDQMLASIGLTRAELMLAPLLPWRPPGGRPASPNELAICQPFLHRLIALLKPRQLVLFGAAPARVILPQVPNRRRRSQRWIESNIPQIPGSRPVLALPALADMLKNPPLRRDAWAGLRLLRRAIDDASK